MPKAGVVPFLIMPLRINLTPKFGLSTWTVVVPLLKLSWLLLGSDSARAHGESER